MVNFVKATMVNFAPARWAALAAKSLIARVAPKFTMVNCLLDIAGVGGRGRLRADQPDSKPARLEPIVGVSIDAGTGGGTNTFALCEPFATGGRP